MILGGGLALLVPKLTPHWVRHLSLVQSSQARSLNKRGSWGWDWGGGVRAERELGQIKQSSLECNSFTIPPVVLLNPVSMMSEGESKNSITII